MDGHDGLQVAVAQPAEKQAFYSSHQTDKFATSKTDPYAASSSSAQFPASSHDGSSPLYTQHQQHQPMMSASDEKPLPLDKRHRLPFGLSVVAYTVVIVVILLVICGAGFGGAIAAVASDKKDCSSSDSATLSPDSAQATATVTTTITSPLTGTSAPASSTSSSSTALATSYVPLLPAQVATAALDCTSGSSVLTPDGSQFQLNCNTNYPGNDIFVFTAYTLTDCVGACANMNTFASDGSLPCRGVLFNANLGSSVATNGGNCWLKSSIGSSEVDGSPPSVGALLVVSS